MHRTLLVLVVVFLASCCGTASAVVLPAGFTQTTVWSGLGNPTVVRFAPDGRAFVASKSGIVNVFDGVSDTTPTQFVDLRGKVHDFWDRGLLGMALDPGFTTGRPYVYVLYAYDKTPGVSTQPRWGDQCPTPPGATADGCVISGRLSRISDTGVETVLIEDFCQQYPSHSVGSIDFGPDGQLYVSAGDGASFNWADYGQDGSPVNPCGDPPTATLTAPTSQGGALRSQSFRRPAGQVVSLDGAILRVNPDTGLASAGNPALGNADVNRRRIVAYGFRNPFRFTFRPGTGEIWSGDVGWDAFEEINRTQNLAQVRNYGWPCYEGASRMGAYDTLNLDSCETLYAEGAGAVTAPYFAYHHVEQVVTGETCTTGSSSISGLVFYTGLAFPAAYKDALFFSDYSRNCIWSVYKGADGLPDMSTRQTFAAQANGPVWLTEGPDGALYYADLSGGTVRRIAADNNAPTARIVATPSSGVAPLAVAFDGTTSTDPEGQTLSYAWDLDGDGAYDDSTASKPSRTYSSAGTITVRLRVTDTGGRVGTTSQTITVGAPPTVAITAPTTWAVGDTIAFSGTARNSAGATLPASALRWSLALRHCSRTDATVCHTHTIQDYVGVASGSFVAPDHDYPSYLQLTLTATDAAGLTTTEVARIDPRTATLTLASDPAGLALSLGSETLLTPFTRTVIARSLNSVAAVTPQPFDDTVFTFAAWSDGRVGAQTITAPASGNLTYTARFTRPSRTSLVGAEVLGLGTPSAGPGRGGIYHMTAAQAGTANSLRLYVDAPSRASRLVLGLYSDAAGHVGTLLGTGTVERPVAGAWNTAYLPAGVPLVSGRWYWLAVLNPENSTGTLAWRDRAGGTRLGQTTPDGTMSALPANWVPGPGHWHADGHVSGGAWADKAPTPEPTPSPSPSPSPSPTGDVSPSPDAGTPPMTLVGPLTPALLGGPPPLQAQVPRLVGAWGFDERSGARAADASAAGNHGLLAGPRRVAGRHGRALAFDGRNDWVTIPDSATLDLKTSFTLEAWVYPTRRSGWRTLAVKESARGLTYGLYAHGGHATTRRERATAIKVPPVRRWTHLAVTYDGAAIRTYLDGALVATRVQTGSLQTSGNPLRFGGNAVWPEWFAGRLDEVRLYDRALTPAQVTADMGTPVDGPVRSDGQRAGSGAKVARFRATGSHRKQVT